MNSACQLMQFEALWRRSAASSADSRALGNGTASPFSMIMVITRSKSLRFCAARASTRDKVIAIMQPHRYTRLSALFNDFATCFNDADSVIVAPVYAAGELPIAGADRDSLVAA